MNRQITPHGTGRPGFGMRGEGRPISVTAADEREFLAAMEAYKRRSGRQFPTWSEILEVLRSIGYEKRVWRPVGVWSAIRPDLAVGDDPTAPVGWFASVETAALP